MHTRPTEKITLLGLIFSSSQVAVTRGAIIQNAAAAPPIKVAARIDARVKPSITLIMLPFDMVLTLRPMIFTAWVRLNPADTTNMLSTRTTLLLERFPSASWGVMQPVMRNRIMLMQATVPREYFPHMYPATVIRQMTRQIVNKFIFFPPFFIYSVFCTRFPR